MPRGPAGDLRGKRGLQTTASGTIVVSWSLGGLKGLEMSLLRGEGCASSRIPIRLTRAGCPSPAGAQRRVPRRRHRPLPAGLLGDPGWAATAGSAGPPTAPASHRDMGS